MTNVGRVAFHGYSDCIELHNAHTRVTFSHQCGGRILQYAWKGENILALDPAQAGWTNQPGQTPIDPWGGRFDIGPEKVIPPRPAPWLGPWSPQVDSAGTVRLTSGEDRSCGVQLQREFRLHPTSSHLTCVQTIKNVSAAERTFCHWSRTLVPGGGIAVIPLTSGSRFPKRYAQYDTVAPSMNFAPEDPNVRERDGFIEIIGPLQHPKLGFDTYAGWMAYLLPSGLLFVKRFPAYRDRVYNDIGSFTTSIWLYQDRLCEIEPIGPAETLAPGASASFTEDWWLLPFAFPARRDGLDLKAVAALVEREAR